MLQSSDAAVELLRQTDNPAVDQLLMAMLKTDDPTAQLQAVEVTLDRGYASGMVKIVSRLSQLRADVTATVIGRACDLSPALRKTIRDNRIELRVNSVEIVRRSCNPSLVYLLSIALRDGHAGIRRAAADGLETYVRGLLHDDVQPREDGAATHWRVRREARRRIRDALADALDAFHVHGERGVIKAAMLLADPDCKPLWLCMERHHDVRADIVLELLADGDDGEMVDFFYQALAMGHHRGRLLNVLEKCGAGPFFKSFLARGYLMAMPRVADSIGRLRAMQMLDGPLDWLAGLPRASRRHLARFVLTSGLPTDLKLGVLTALSESGDARERLDVLVGALSMADGGGDPLIHALLTDPDEDVQRFATRGIVYRKCANAQQLLLRQLNSEFESVRRLASRRLAMFTFEYYWDAFERLGELQQLAAGRALQKLDSAFEDRLRARLAGGTPDLQIRAMRILRLLGVEAGCARQLMRLSQEGASKVRATAVRLLGRVHNSDAIETASEALTDVDARVQANAIESLEEQGCKPLVEKVGPMLGSVDNRIVANAAKALAASLAEALPAIKRLLADRRVEYRLSGLWVMGQLHLPQLFSEIVRICRMDKNPRVRKRAIEILTDIRNSLIQEDS